MIVVRQKPLEEVRSLLDRHRVMLLVGCNTCAAVAMAGGENETSRLAATLRIAARRDGCDQEYRTAVLKRQCEPEFLGELELEGVDALLSLGCGAGVALLAEVTGLPVYPALDTLFIGAARGYGSWRAECSACGRCVLGETAGICPVTRCAKGIMNGPCGGVDRGKCEVDSNHDCAWVLIRERRAALGLDADDEVRAPRDFSRRIAVRAWGLPDAEEGSR